MPSLLRFWANPDSPAVLSFSVQAGMAPVRQPRSQFEIMVRHLFDRMLNNEAFGEDAATRMTQLAYAIALPGVLVSLFLFVAYHRPPPLHLERSFWSQACDHLFFVTYAFVVLGTAIVFQWEMLFPDLLDVYVLTSLPIRTTRLLLGRLTALAIFLALVQVETSGLGTFFFPAAADLKCGFWRHLTAHAAAVTLAALFATTFFIALQSLLVCLPGRISTRVSAFVKVVSIIGLLTILFLLPLVTHSLERLVAEPTRAARWYPPFWFLGMYETALHGSAAPAVFHHLAHRGLAATALLALAGVVLYPVAYRRRVRHLVEGMGATRRTLPLAALLRRVLHLAVVRTPRGRAVFHFAAQTLMRLPRLHLYLAMYAGAGLALMLSGLLVFLPEGDTVRAVLSGDGVRMAVPVVAFWSVMGLRTALHAPLCVQGSWVFRVVGGRAGEEELGAGELLAASLSLLLTLGVAATLYLVRPPERHGAIILAGQGIVAVGLCLVLTDLAFLPMRSIPFTATRKRSHRELPQTLVTYFVLFPFFALFVVEKETWIEASWAHLVKTLLVFAALHATLRYARRRVMRSVEPMEELLFVGLGLHGE